MPIPLLVALVAAVGATATAVKGSENQEKSDQARSYLNNAKELAEETQQAVEAAHAKLEKRVKALNKAMSQWSMLCAQAAKQLAQDALTDDSIDFNSLFIIPEHNEHNFTLTKFDFLNDDSLESDLEEWSDGIIGGIKSAFASDEIEAALTKAQNIYAHVKKQAEHAQTVIAKINECYDVLEWPVSVIKQAVEFTHSMDWIYRNSDRQRFLGIHAGLGAMIAYNNVLVNYLPLFEPDEDPSDPQFQVNPNFISALFCFDHGIGAIWTIMDTDHAPIYAPGFNLLYGDDDDDVS